MSAKDAKPRTANDEPMGNPMDRKSDKYAEFVDHPRYGQRPNITGLNPSPLDSDVHLHWNAVDHAETVARFEAISRKKWPYGNSVSYSNRSRRIANTAIQADLARLSRPTAPSARLLDMSR